MNNSGNRNSGNFNSGDYNSGNFNSGDFNSGYYNSGYYNSGDYNSGNFNSGDFNSGYYNSGYYNSGHFNCDTPTEVRVFGKYINIDIWRNAPKPDWIYKIKLTEWIPFCKMNRIQKIENPNATIENGFLLTYTYKEAWAIAYEKATKEDIELTKKLPNFCPVIFEKITGIDLSDDKFDEPENTCRCNEIKIDDITYVLTPKER